MCLLIEVGEFDPTCVECVEYSQYDGSAPLPEQVDTGTVFGTLVPVDDDEPEHLADCIQYVVPGTTSCDCGVGPWVLADGSLEYGSPW